MVYASLYSYRLLLIRGEACCQELQCSFCCDSQPAGLHLHSPLAEKIPLQNIFKSDVGLTLQSLGLLP